MTIFEHIDTIRVMLKQTSDDTQYSGQLIYKMMLDARGLLLWQRLQKKQKLSKFNYMSFCIQLEPATYHDCGTCIPDVGCRILKGTTDLPKVLSNKYTDYLKIFDTTGVNELGNVSATQHALVKYSNTMKDKWFFEIVNRKPVVWGQTTLEYLYVTMIPEDPVEVSNLNLCDVSGAGCYDPETDEFPIDASLNQPMYEIVVKQMLYSLQLSDDLTNNAESTENERQKNISKKQL